MNNEVGSHLGAIFGQGGAQVGKKGPGVGLKIARMGAFWESISKEICSFRHRFLGAFLARMQGLQTLHRIKESLREGRMPSGELLDALLIVIAGLVLLTPGFLTDSAGFLLLIPATRNSIKYWLRRHIELRYMSNRPEDIIIEQ